MERLIRSPSEKSATFFIGTLLNKTDVLIIKSNYKLHSMTTKNVRKKNLHALHFKWSMLNLY